MKRIDFFKTIVVAVSLPVLAAVTGMTNHDDAMKKIATYVDMASSNPSIGYKGITIFTSSVTQMDIDYINRNLKYRHTLTPSSNVNLSTGTSKFSAFTIVFKTQSDMKLFLTELKPYLKKFNKRDTIDKALRYI